MASFNKVILLGNLTRDPEVRYTPKGSAVCDLGIAGEYLRKGRPVFIEGRLQMDSWDDKQTGQKRTKLRVVGESMQLLGGRPGGAGAAAETAGEDRQTSAGAKTSAPPPKPSAPAQPDEDEIPF